jgi:hypothetical protein
MEVAGTLSGRLAANRRIITFSNQYKSTFYIFYQLNNPITTKQSNQNIGKVILKDNLKSPF